MKPLEGALAAMLALVQGPAWSADDPAAEGARPQTAPTTPTTSAPAETPPAPPAKPPALPPKARAADAQSAQSGHWVYTQQYGWVWMPYGDAYSYVPPTGEGEPYEYVYYPAYGWTWVVAPWIWGYGPWPYFGVYGAAHFGWYGHGFWRSPWRWHYRPTFGFSHGFRSAPFRGGFVAHGASHGHFGHVGGGFRGGGHR